MCTCSCFLQLLQVRRRSSIAPADVETASASGFSPSRKSRMARKARGEQVRGLLVTRGHPSLFCAGDRVTWRRREAGGPGRPSLLACRGWISPAVEPRCPSCLTQSAPTTGKNSQRPLPRCQPAAESSVETHPCSTSPAGVPRQQRCKEAVRRCRRYVPRAAEDHSFPTPMFSEEKRPLAAARRMTAVPLRHPMRTAQSACAATSVRIVSERAFESSAAYGCQLWQRVRT
jgi:hypothetical protein